MSAFADFIASVERGDLESVVTFLNADRRLVNERDKSGATALHHAAFRGHRDIVRLLVQRGAEINSIDARFKATPAGWAIEYLRELGGYLATDLEDLAYAIRQGDAPWVKRFLARFPKLRRGSDAQGISFSRLAKESGSQTIIDLFS